ncbi:MAG: N-acetylmuramoyl-L-alanine amidase [Ferrovibrio sp.]|uniref:N-acetylmuramoyl-L-alanine amidase n=1 Tax=Ferrovibrio sp. TaxID=1917215 RepID=UPI00391A5893
MRKTTDYIVIHCAATKPTMDIGAKEIERWHRERGFFKIGYHFVIRRDGTIETGRALEEAGAHAQGFNHKSIGICLVGGIGMDGKAENNFTAEQWESLRSLVVRMKAQYPNAEVLGHRDLPGVKKDCPSFDVRGWWSQHAAN